MESIPKFLASMITIVVGVLLCVSFIISTVVVNSARTYHASIIEEIEASGFDEVVIQKCIEAAEQDSYNLKIEEVVSTESGVVGFYQVTLNYKLSAPIFGVVHNGEIIGYASKGTRIVEKLKPGLYLSGSDYGVLLTPWDELVANGDVKLTETKITSFNSDLAGDLVIEDSVTVIGASSFDSREKLTGVIIPSGVTSVGGSAFYGCSTLEHVIFKEDSKLTQIGDWAFYECIGLDSIELPEGLQTIGEDAFGYCRGLGKITIPSTVTSLGENLFPACTGLTKIKVAEGNTVYHSDGNCLIETETKTLIQGCQTSVIPSDGSVTTIGYWAFYEHASFNPWAKREGDRWGTNQLIIPDGITALGDRSFARCTSLEKAHIPEGVTSIGDTFCGCASLKEVTIPGSVTSIGYQGFYGCGRLEKINFGGTLDDWIDMEWGSLWDYYTPNYTVYFAGGSSMTKEEVNEEIIRRRQEEYESAAEEPAA